MGGKGRVDLEAIFMDAYILDGLGRGLLLGVCCGSHTSYKNSEWDAG